MQRKRAENVTPHVDLNGVILNYVTEDYVTNFCIELAESEYDRCHWISNLNACAVNMCYEDRQYADANRRADLIFCDGRGLALSLGLFGYSIPPQVTYNRWLPKLLEELYKKHLTAYFIGDSEAVIQKAWSISEMNWPGVVVGFHHGFFQVDNGWSSSPTVDEQSVCAEVNRLGPDVLVVGMGMPRQEQFIKRHLDRLHVKVILNGGACFRFLSGESPVAPRWVSFVGLEWAFRWLHEPARLWRRYLVGNPLLLARIAAKRVIDLRH